MKVLILIHIGISHLRTYSVDLWSCIPRTDHLTHRHPNYISAKINPICHQTHPIKDLINDNESRKSRGALLIYIAQYVERRFESCIQYISGLKITCCLPHLFKNHIWFRHPRENKPYCFHYKVVNCIRELLLLLRRSAGQTS